MPESLVGALEGLGHEVDSVNHLKLKGLDNGTRYRQVAIGYDLCFTRDSAFAHNVRQTLFHLRHGGIRVAWGKVASRLGLGS